MQENFRTVYVNDFNNDCLRTLKYNNKNLEYEGALIDNTSILSLDPKELKNKLGIKGNDIDVFFGGIVCKGFSLAGERNPIDEKNYFYHKQLELVREFKPKISIIENVIGILNAKVYVGSEDDPTKNNINDLWKNLENYKGKKAALRKVNGISK